MTAPKHAELVGLPDSELLNMAADATHQHYKGGPYRDLGGVVHVEHPHLGTVGLEGKKLRAYVHRHPHSQDAWVREEDEFLSLHEDAPRFRPLTGAATDIPGEREDHGYIRDADTGAAYMIGDSQCRLITENGIAIISVD